MKISEMNKILKDMKKIVDFKNEETTINVRSSSIDPYCPFETVQLLTTINDINISMHKELDKRTYKKE